MYRLLASAFVRRRLRVVVALGVGCGLLAGVGLWGLAAARRTASTYERYLAAADASDVSFNVNTAERALTLEELADLAEAARQLPGVVADASYIGLETMALEVALEDPAGSGEFVGSIDGRFLQQDKVAVVDGRLPRADRADEILVNEQTAAIWSLAVGDTTQILVADGEAFEQGEIVLAGEFEAEVVGIGVFADDVLDDEYDRLPRLLLTPAATELWMDVAGTYIWQGLRLADGADVDAVVAAYRELAGEDAFVNTLVTADQARDVQRAVRPTVAALAVFGSAALLTALVIGATAAGRLARNRPELPVLRAVGVAPRTLRLLSSAPAGIGAVLAGLVAVVVAVALSPLAPVGSIRAVEPNRGVDLDGLVLVGGVVLIVVAVAMAGFLATLRAVATRTPAVVSTAAARSGAVVAALPAPAALGVRRGLGAGATTGAPTRATLVGTTVALVAVVGAVTFGASIEALADEPARYGWVTDLALVAGAGYDTIDLAQAERFADADDRIESLAVAGFASIEVGEVLVPGMALEVVRGTAPVTVLDGRLPERGDEVALGRRTADQLDVALGDDVAGPTGRLTVTGIVAFPAIGQATSSHPGMGNGALLTPAGIGRGEAQPSIAFVGLVEGIDGDDVAGELAEAFAPSTDGGLVDPYSLLRPAELDGAEDATGTVGAIAAIVGGVALAATAAVVLASVRGRHRELAILRALGFTGADLRRSVRWQAATLSVVAVVISAPLGVAAGRLLWQVFARTLGVDPSPTVPLLLVLGLGAGMILVAVLAALPAARRAARLPVAPALRPE